MPGADEGRGTDGIGKTNADFHIDQSLDITVIILHNDFHQLFDFFRFLDHALQQVFRSQHHGGHGERTRNGGADGNLVAESFLHQTKAFQNDGKAAVLIHIHQLGAVNFLQRQRRLFQLGDVVIVILDLGAHGFCQAPQGGRKSSFIGTEIVKQIFLQLTHHFRGVVIGINGHIQKRRHCFARAQTAGQPVNFFSLREQRHSFDGCQFILGDFQSVQILLNDCLIRSVFPVVHH